MLGIYQVYTMIINFQGIPDEHARHGAAATAHAPTRQKAPRALPTMPPNSVSKGTAVPPAPKLPSALSAPNRPTQWHTRQSQHRPRRKSRAPLHDAGRHARHGKWPSLARTAGRAPHRDTDGALAAMVARTAWSIGVSAAARCVHGGSVHCGSRGRPW